MAVLRNKEPCPPEKSKIHLSKTNSRASLSEPNPTELVAARATFVRLLLIHPDRLFREGLAFALSKDTDFQITGCLADTRAAQAEAAKFNPDVVLVGNSPPQKQSSVIKILAKVYPRARIIALGLVDSEDEILDCIEAGAIGYVLANAAFSDLVTVTKAAGRGESIATPQFTAVLCHRVSVLRGLAQPVVVAGTQPLSRREREVIPLVVAGLQNKEIAIRLHIETQTVKNHVHNILEKLGLRTRHEITYHAQLARLL